MGRPYKPRQMPKRFLEGAPEVVRKGVLDIIATPKDAVLDYDVIWREDAEGEAVGLDFGDHGWRGCHFFLKPHELRAYRDRNRRKRVAWGALPAATQKSIINSLNEGV